MDFLIPLELSLSRRRPFFAKTLGDYLPIYPVKGYSMTKYIRVNVNRGYGYGALDSFNEGLDFARCGYRPYVAIFNFDAQKN